MNGLEAAGRASAEFVKDAVLKVCESAPRGLPDTHKDRLNSDSLEFLRS